MVMQRDSVATLGVPCAGAPSSAFQRCSANKSVAIGTNLTWRRRREGVDLTKMTQLGHQGAFYSAPHRQRRVTPFSAQTVARLLHGTVVHPVHRYGLNY